MTEQNNAPRLQYLDWLRGLAAVLMLQGHVFHSFTRPDLRGDSAYVLSQFAGGMPPAIFLFLTGMTLAFRLDGLERRGASAGARVLGALRRAGYLLAVAFLFRLQLWAFAWPGSPWTDLFKVDILNCMALAAAVMAAMGVFRTAERVRLCAVLGLAVAFAGPLVTRLDWAAAPELAKRYLAPDYQYFSFFPWAAFLAFGVSAGSLIRLLREQHMERAMQWATLLGGVLVIGGRYFAEIPYSLLPSSEFWLNSPSQVLIKLGVLLWMMAFAYLWTRYATAPGWSWVRQLGVTSLLVYWVHIELVYGRWFGAWKESLDNVSATAATLAVIAGMVALSVAKTTLAAWSARPEALRWQPWRTPVAETLGEPRQ